MCFLGCNNCVAVKSCFFISKTTFSPFANSWAVQEGCVVTLEGIPFAANSINILGETLFNASLINFSNTLLFIVHQRSSRRVKQKKLESLSWRRPHRFLHAKIKQPITSQPSQWHFDAKGSRKEWVIRAARCHTRILSSLQNENKDSS